MSSLPPRSAGPEVDCCSVWPECCSYYLPRWRKCPITRQEQSVRRLLYDTLNRLTDCIDFFGGNSTKATSGINAALTRTQVDEKIQDSVKQFYDDTIESARDKARPDLIKVLTYQSASAVEWLQDVFNLDLTLVSRLGYVHSV